MGGRAGIPIAGEKAHPYLGWQRGTVIGVPHFDERFHCNLFKCEKKMTFTGLWMPIHKLQMVWEELQQEAWNIDRKTYLPKVDSYVGGGGVGGHGWMSILT